MKESTRQEHPPEESQLPLDEIIQGDCLDVLPTLPEASVDVVFADPPYNLQLQQELRRPNNSLVDAVDDDWDQFKSFAEYDQFTCDWLSACRRVLKPTGTLWVIGSYHNIFRVGKILQDIGYWILNDIVWIKCNPMPNFRGVRFTNAHETLIWAQRERGVPYTFNHQAMKALNEDLQMRSDWMLPLCTGKERLRSNGQKAHPTQKPESLLYRVLLSSTNPGEVVLDPFFGTGTTGAIAKRLHRRYIGIERNARYVALARQRIAKMIQTEFDPPLFVTPSPRRQARIPFGTLLESGLIEAGQILYFGADTRSEITARVLADGSLEYDGQRGSIHQIARLIRRAPCNGWEAWYFWDTASGQRLTIEHLRQQIRSEQSEER